MASYAVSHFLQKKYGICFAITQNQVAPSDVVYVNQKEGDEALIEMTIKTLSLRQALVFAFLFFPGSALPANSLIEKSITELQYQYGCYEIPTFVPEIGGQSERGSIVTVQHFDSWKYGENFFFIDFLYLDKTGSNTYGEFYPSFSVIKFKKSRHHLKEVGLILGFNYDRVAKVRKYTPGIRTSWDVKGFTFLNVDIMAYLDGNPGIECGGSPKESGTLFIDVNWVYSFQIGTHRFSSEGHVEYIHQRRNELGMCVAAWVMGQPQLRYDLGYALFKKPDHLFFGIEYQFWIHKLGDRETTENAPQLLVAWRF